MKTDTEVVCERLYDALKKAIGTMKELNDAISVVSDRSRLSGEEMAENFVIERERMR